MAKIKVDSAGVLRTLKSGEVRQAVDRLAGNIASDVRGNVDPDAEVVTDSYTTDRAAASVTIRDTRARIWEARDGVLTRAAIASGLEVKAR